MLSTLLAGQILALTMDREFIEKNGRCLVDVRYIVRLKNNAQVDGRATSYLCEANRWKRLASGVVEVLGQQVRYAR